MIATAPATVNPTRFTVLQILLQERLDAWMEAEAAEFEAWMEERRRERAADLMGDGAPF